MNKTRWVVLALIGVVCAPALRAVDVRVDRDPRFDLKQVQTWTWSPTRGEVKMLVSASDDPDALRQQLEPIIVDAVGKELAGRGYVERQDGPADVRVTYYLLISAGTSAQQAGQFLPAVAQWGIPLFAPQTTSLRVMEQGSLVIDLASQALDSVVWRGVAQAEIDRQRTGAQRAQRIRDAIEDLVAKLPKRSRG
jgi:Domain of unknown function (DUF4136)